MTTIDSVPTIRLPTGVRDFLPRATVRRRAIANRLLEQFEHHGYQRLITPIFEHAEVIERGLGSGARAAAIRFVEPKTGEVVALRPDITPQIARIAATRMGDIAGPLRLCYEGAVTRLSSGPRGQREILQAGVELIDAASPEGDAEVIAVAAAALSTTGIAEVRLDVGHVELARHALADVADASQRAELRALLGRKDRGGVAAAARGLPVELQALLAALPTLFGEPRAVLRRARRLRLAPRSRSALRTVERVLAMTRDVLESELHAGITMDLGEVRGFEYYTGIRFAGYARGAGDAVLRGGRYDELVGRYGRPARATGFAVDIEAIAQAQGASGVEPPAQAPRVLVSAVPARQREATKIAAALRACGIAAAVDLRKGALRGRGGRSGGGGRARTATPTYAAGVGFARVLLLGPADAQILDVALSQASPSKKSAAKAVSRAIVTAAVAGRAAALAVRLDVG